MDTSDSDASNAARRKTLQKELKRLEGAIYDLELKYLQESKGGNAVRGWDMNGSVAEPGINVNSEEMVFSKSSLSSPWPTKSLAKTQLKKPTA